MRADSELEQDVLSELQRAPELDETDIAVKAQGGVVTLSGVTQSRADKVAAEEAAKRVAGVRAIANEIEVHDPPNEVPSDPQIAREAVRTLRQTFPGLHESLRVIVCQGHLTLEGTTPLYFQRDQVELSMRRLAGVKSITNAIAVAPPYAATKAASAV
jgi:osmotically-inducible protein OsmY